MGRRSSKKKEIVNQLQFQFVEQFKAVPISGRLKENLAQVQAFATDNSDYVIREFRLKDSVAAFVFYVDGLVSGEQVDFALKEMMLLEGGFSQLNSLESRVVAVSQMGQAHQFADVLLGVLSGDTALFVEGNQKASLLGLRGPQMRSVSEPELETAVRGPREGFIENIRINTSLLRRKLKTPFLKMKPMIVGKQSNTDVIITYMEGVVDPALVEEVTKRIEKIDIDAVFESGYIEEFIQDNAHSPFPQLQYTERPDTLAASLLEGRVGIMVDGTPMVLIAPITFWTLLQANEDYYERFKLGTLIRWMRYVFFLMGLLGSSIYIAVTTYHQALLPTSLLLSVAASREQVPFPAVIEAFILEISFEALREAGVRLPKAVGQAVSILGGLVVGQAAVEAGIVSAAMVIVVAGAGIASFTIPRYNMTISIRLLRFIFMILASLFGIYGILVGLIILIGHLANLRSFGVPYLSPISPLSTPDLKDVLWRAPWWMQKERPSFMSLRDTQRMGDELVDEIKRDGGQTGKDIDHDEPKKGE
ncbi:hypothetical protein BEP19_03910 [Ammoniphilus oxalaticus]|uniref:Uncharacterized protein n=1 Tax=Ammoniphilus oxalaticus TaxID=66863 RepID=A0A419SLN8_9BACL|nr:spore germination protein [Ammoniphilus oxalaticus]RKD24990.1 hypothetical protein BEP19_03910 [Ammoniphilus oxalaticus]